MTDTGSTKTSDISLSTAQKIVDDWISSVGNGYFDILTNMAMLTEEVGETARVIARSYGAQRPKTSDNVGTDALADELSDVLWVVMAIANQTGIDLTKAFINNIAKKNIRDKERFL